MIVRSADFEQRESESTGTGFDLSGYMAVFDQDTEINSNFEGKFLERISRGAFTKTLRTKKPVVQYDHGRDSRVGSIPIAEIIELREDAKGLWLEARMFDNPVVDPIRQAIAAQAIHGASFKFRVTRDEWRDAKGKRVRPDELEQLLFGGNDSRGPLKRNIKEVDLAELGPVVFPAYAGTSVGVRSGKTNNPPELLKMRLVLMNWN
ncbi:HK97 family phage prohead protease [Rhodococcus sp. IEGM 1370]|nr:HK97 family phage prohead protease [Rhodococcus sp. IEGM 1370]